MLRLAPLKSLLWLVIVGFLSSCGTTDTAPTPSGDLIVTPSTVQMTASTQIEFTASGPGATGGISWSATGGTVKTSGFKATYTAPMQAGDYTITVTSSGNKKTAAAKIHVVASGVAQTRRITPNSATFTQPNEEHSFVLEAIDAQGKPTTPPNGVRWEINPPGAFTLTVNANGSHRVTVRALQVVAEATLQAYSASTGAELLTASLVSAVLKDNVKRLQDDDLVFPPPSQKMTVAGAVDIRDIQGVTMIGSFRADEVLAIANSASTEDKTQFPIVLRGPSPGVGRMLASVESGGIYGTVLEAVEREGFTLIRLEQAGPQEIFSNLVLNLDSSVIGQAISSQSVIFKNSLKDVKFEFKRGCLTGTLDPKIIDSVTFLPVKFEPSVQGTIDIKQGIYKFKTRLDYSAELKIALKFPVDITGKLSCDISKPVTIELPPLTGPAALIWNAALVVTPKISLEATMKLGAPLDLGVRAKGSGFVQAGFECTGNTCSDLTNSDFVWEPKAWNDSTLSTDLQTRRSSFSTTAGVFFNEKMVSEFGTPILRACRYLEGTSLAFVSKLKETCDTLRKRLLLSIIEADVGGEAIMTWESTRLVLEGRATNSEASARLVGRLKVGDGLNKMLNVLQLKSITSPIVQVELPLGSLYRPYIVDSFQASVKGLPTTLVTDSGQTVAAFTGDDVQGNVQVKLKPMPNAVFDTNLTGVSLWLTSEAEPAALNTATAKLSGTAITLDAHVSAEICSLKNPMLHIIGYSSMFGIKTASHLGYLKPLCQTLETVNAINPKGRYLAYIKSDSSAYYQSTSASTFPLKKLIEGTDLKIDSIYNRCFKFTTQGSFIYGTNPPNARTDSAGIVLKAGSNFIEPGPRATPSEQNYNGGGAFANIPEDFFPGVIQIPQSVTDIVVAPIDFPLYDNISAGPFNLIVNGPVECPLK